MRTLIVSSYCSWQIEDPKEFLKSISSVENAEKLHLPNILGSATAEVLGRYGLSDLVNTDRTKLKYEQIEAEITKAAQLKAKAYGINIKEARLRLFSFPPDKTTKSLLKRMKQQRIVKAGKLRVQGETQPPRNFGRKTRLPQGSDFRPQKKHTYFFSSFLA